MGMFDKDKQFGMRMDREFAPGEHFVLWGVNITGETIATDFGDAEMVRFKVSKMESPSHKYEVSTVAAAIVEKAKEAEDSDFPAVVKLDRVKGRYRDNTLVMQFVSAYNGSGAGEGVRREESYTEPQRGPVGDDDLPF